MGWDLLVDRKDLRHTTLVPADPDIALADGEALLAVESFALTANNITYGAVGDQVGYWKFFPAPDGLGRIPVWGFARVVRSSAADAPVGLRLFGYWPMSSHTVARLAKTSQGYVETSAHRAELPPTYTTGSCLSRASSRSRSRSWAPALRRSRCYPSAGRSHCGASLQAW